MAKLISKPKQAAKEPDELVTMSQRVWALITENPTRATGIAGGILGAVLLVLFALFIMERGDQKRLVTVARTVDQYLAPDDASQDGGALIEELRRQSEEYSGKTEGGLALYFLAGALAETGDHAAAAQAYGKVREAYAGNVNLANAAALGQAYAYRLMKKNDEALGIFQELLAQVDAPVPHTQVQLEIGTIYEEQGKVKEATDAYRALAESDPDGDWGRKANGRLEVLEGA